MLSSVRQLHRVLLALFRAEAKSPEYSHIRHGPLEYGKDIVVCREDGGRRILSIYSVKVGVLKKATWHKEVCPQLEEMYLVPLNSPEIPSEIDEHISILVWNNHFDPYAEPLVNGWLKVQYDTFGRKYELMHIDRLVSYVTQNSLGGTLRQALRAEGLLP